MEETQKILSENLISLRKSRKLTQQEFAEILGYSDKSVSKWEGEKAIPSAEILLKIADYYSVTVDQLLRSRIIPGKTDAPLTNRQRITNQIAIVCLVATFLLIVATCIFVNGVIQEGFSTKLWIAFIWAIPAVCLSSAFLAYRFWGKGPAVITLLSIFIWGFILSFSLTFLLYSNQNIFFIFFVGIPVQIAVILYATIKK